MLFKSYLTNKIQTVRINNKLSKFSIIICDVPWGTVLVKIVFNIYVNGLLNIPNLPGNINRFFNDTVVLVSIDKPKLYPIKLLFYEFKVSTVSYLYHKNILLLTN